MKDAVIVAYGRSAIGRGGKGALREANPVDYGAQVLMGVLKKIPSFDPKLIEDVIVGCAKPQDEQGSIFGRVIAQRAGLDDSVPGQTVNRFCSSGLQSIATAANAIMAGQAEILVAGGVESMTLIPMGTPDKVKDKWIMENRPDVYMPMGLTAEKVAKEYGVTREEMDALGVESHLKAAKAQAEGKFDSQIIPVDGLDKEGKAIQFSKDEGIRANTTMEGLAALKPAFKEDGIVTAGTASQVSDGAGFVVMMSKDKAQELGLKPIAKFVAFAVAGVPPGIMGIGPIYAVPKVMKMTGMTVNDMDVIELNEAFAAQAIPCMRELKLPKDKINPYGGAIALGHPLGATGAILTCKALSRLQETGGKYALVTMCIGTGMGAAGIFEMCK